MRGLWILLLIVGSATLAVAENAKPDPVVRGDKAFAAKDWKAAAEAYGAVVAADATNGRAWFRRGYALHVLGDFDAAIVAHRKAAAFPKFKPVAHYNAACAEARRGNADAAFTHLAKAVAAGFRSPKKIGADADLASLKDDKRFRPLEQQALPPAQRDLYRRFDFWVGAWDVMGRNGKQVGTNRITKSQGGLVLTENWTSASGLTGTSVNFVDPTDGAWKQIWLDPTGGVTRYSGGWKDNAMRFEGVHTTAAGKQTHKRMTFRRLSGVGALRQTIEDSKDGGATWAVTFEGNYLPQSRKK